MYGSYTPMQNMIFVSDDEAQRYILPPNSKVLLMSKDNPIFYVKTTDTLGQATIDSYRFERINSTTPNTVTQADFAKFKDEILALLSRPKEDPQSDNK